MASGVGPKTGMRGIFSTVAEWVSPSLRRVIGVPCGKGLGGGVAFVAIKSQENCAIALDLAEELRGGVASFVEAVVGGVVV